MSNKVPANFLLLFSAILFVVTGIHAQTKPTNDFNLSATGHLGFLIGHHGSMRYLMEEHVKGFELTFTKPTHGEKLWQRAYHYPQTGISFIYLDLGNPQHLGYGVSLFPFINFPLVTGRSVSLYFRAGSSLGYISKKFDRVTNHKNDVIGSHINGFMNFYLNAAIKLTNALDIKSGIGITHFSNAAITVPNLGVNIPTLTLGLTYRFNTKNIQLVADTFTHTAKRNDIVLYYLGGVCELEPINGPKYFTYGLDATLERTFNTKSKFITGVDIFYNTANIDKLKQKEITITRLQNIQAGVKVGYALIVNRLSLPIETGVYLYTKLISNGYVYNRIGIRYDFSKHFILSLTLKTHFAKADYFEAGIGYKL